MRKYTKSQVDRVLAVLELAMSKGRVNEAKAAFAAGKTPEEVTAMLNEPEEMGPTEEWYALCEAHRAECNRRRARFTNFGWVNDGGVAICSKTTIGCLTTGYADDGTFSHEWE